MPFRPAVVPTLALAGSLAILINLGSWQYGRHLTQEVRLATIDESLHAPSLTSQALTLPADQLEWHHAAMTGTLSGPVQLIAGSYAFGANGFRMVQTLHTDHGAVLVDRGWIPVKGAQQILAETEAHAGDVTTIQGLLLPIEPIADRPDADTSLVPGALVWRPQFDRWLGFVPRQLGAPWAAMAAAAGEGVTNVYLVAGPERKRGEAMLPAPPPIGGYVARPKEITHFSYAMQWYLIAATALGVWIYAGIARGRKST